MRGVLVADLKAAETARVDFIVLAPHFAGLSAEAADIVGMMPIGSVNEALLAALPATMGAMPCRVVAGLFLCDPFLRGRRLFERLRAGGVHSVVNLPTAALVPPGVYRQALVAAGIEPGAELAALSEAREAGLDPMATVASYDQAARAVDAGIVRLLFHPGVPTGDGGLDQRLVEGVVASISRIKAIARGPRMALYRHPGFGARLAPAVELADDVMEWAVPAPERGSGVLPAAGSVQPV